jgi:hypothetical protein
VAGGPPAAPSSLKDLLKEASFRSAEDAWRSSSNKGRPSAFLRLYSEAVSGASFGVLSDRQELLLSPPSNNKNCHIIYICTKNKKKAISTRGLQSGGYKECSLSWLTNGALVYEAKCGGRGEQRPYIYID